MDDRECYYNWWSLCGRLLDGAGDGGDGDGGWRSWSRAQSTDRYCHVEDGCTSLTLTATWNVSSDTTLTTIDHARPTKSAECLHLTA